MHSSVSLTTKPRGALFALRRRSTSADKPGDNSCRKRKNEASMMRPPPKHGGPPTWDGKTGELVPRVYSQAKVLCTLLYHIKAPQKPHTPHDQLP